MKKKNIIVIGSSILIILLAIFVGYKVYNFRKFSFDNEKYLALKSFAKGLNVKDTIKIVKGNRDDIDYLEYKNIKIKNVVKDFSEDKERLFDSFDSAGSYVLKENDNFVARFSYGIEEYTIKSTMEYARAFSIIKKDGNIERTDMVDIAKFFKDNNINSDTDLIKYAEKHKTDELNIVFDSVNTRKVRTYIYSYLNLFLGNVDDIILITGDYDGFITLNYQDNGITKTIVRILGEKETYYFAFIAKDDYYSLNNIKEIISTIEIG